VEEMLFVSVYPCCRFGAKESFMWCHWWRHMGHSLVAPSKCFLAGHVKLT
jgi:hypothetical protein